MLKVVLGTIRLRPALTAGIGAVLIALSAAGIAYFQPHKLFIDDRVAEDLPVTSPTSALSPSGIQPSPDQFSSAEFRALEHETIGRAVLTGLPDGSRTLSFVDFKTSNGPDLRVYLSAGDSDRAFGKQYGEDFVELGKLKGNIGNQNYQIPKGTDLSKYRNAVIWCKRFSVGFGVATF